MDLFQARLTGTWTRRPRFPLGSSTAIAGLAAAAGLAALVQWAIRWQRCRWYEDELEDEQRLSPRWLPLSSGAVGVEMVDVNAEQAARLEAGSEGLRALADLLQQHSLLVS